MSIRELRNSTADVIRRLEDGGELTLTKRGKPIARITPLADLPPGRQLLDALDSAGFVDTGLAAEVATWRAADADAEDSAPPPR